MPFEIDCLLPENSFTYLIHEVVEQIPEVNIPPFESVDGRPTYHPRILLKALLFVYSEGDSSGRRIQKIMEENH
ncbi:hypothetical protein [Facklamia miroungae]|uniref:hypothetical protein n=1 Tax=Facklamia miroungae TaxID=120956 RepID=UPI000B7C88ED|nr:hypothetical protein [Facklamia miroungae]NKZ29272.1 transposase [Facklamia miroungae]